MWYSNHNLNRYLNLGLKIFSYAMTTKIQSLAILYTCMIIITDSIVIRENENFFENTMIIYMYIYNILKN